MLLAIVIVLAVDVVVRLVDGAGRAGLLVPACATVGSCMAWREVLHALAGLG